MTRFSSSAVFAKDVYHNKITQLRKQYQLYLSFTNFKFRVKVYHDSNKTKGVHWTLLVIQKITHEHICDFVQQINVMIRSGEASTAYIIACLQSSVRIFHMLVKTLQKTLIAKSGDKRNYKNITKCKTLTQKLQK